MDRQPRGKIRGPRPRTALQKHLNVNSVSICCVLSVRSFSSELNDHVPKSESKRSDPYKSDIDEIYSAEEKRTGQNDQCSQTLTGRLHGTIVGQTVVEPPTSVNQINVAD